MPDQPPKAVEVDGTDIAPPAEATEEAENIGVKIVNGGAWRLIAYGFATGVAVLSTAVVSRAIGPVDFAAFTTAISLISIATGFTDFGLLALGIREFAALRGAERERHLRALITLRLIFTGIGAVVIVAFAIAAGYSQGVVKGLAVAAVGLWVTSLYISYCVPLQATYRFNELAALDASRQGLWSGLMILAAITGGGVGLIIATLLPTAIIVTIAAGLLAHRIASVVPSWDPPAMRSLLASVGAFAVAASVGASYAYLAQVASDAVLSGHDSGQFALAFRVFAVLIGAGYVVIIGAFPLLVTTAKDQDLERMAYATRRVMQAGILAGFACAVGLLSGAAFVVSILGGPEFDGAVELVAIIGFALPSSFVLLAGSTVLLAAGRHRALVLVAVVGALVSIAGTTLLAAEFGGTGAAIGIVLGELLLATGYLVAISRVDRSALPTFKWFGGVLLAVGAGCAVSLTGLPSFIEAILALVVYGAAAVLLGIVPPEIRDRLPLIPGRSGTE